MTFTIPNKALLYPFQSRIFQSDMDILAASVGGRNGVISDGCLIQASSPVNDMAVHCLSGQVVIEYGLYDIADQAVNLDDSDALLPRFDTIVALTDGTVVPLTGIPDAAPVPVSPIANSVGLGQVYVPASAPVILDTQIVDKRIFVPSPIAPSEWTLVGATADLDRSNSNVLTIDPELQFSVVANGVYRMRFAFMFSKAALVNTGWQIGFTGPALSVSGRTFGGTAILYSSVFSGSAILLNAQSYPGLVGTYGVSSTSLPVAWHLNGDLIVKFGAAGTFGMTWAQSSSANAGIITRHAGSYIEFEKV
jgi:hypothetical protein